MPIHGYPGGVITANPVAPTVSSASGVWTTEQQLLNQSAGRWPMAATQISRSLRFNSADSAYLNRTPASASNRKTWTWSGWVKRSTLASAAVHSFFGACDATAGNTNWLGFVNDSLAFIVADGNSGNVITSAVYRDVSAWYHIVMVYDSTQATASNRQKIYVNGVQVTVFSASTYVSQNLDGFINNNVQHGVGARIRPSGTANLFFPGYLAEVNFIDGLALDPSYFGFNDSNTGAWTPKQYTGAYGTNGFYVNFSDNSGTTSTTLGKDYSGNGNNWTPNNFSVTAGVGNDSLVDSPTSYGTDTGVGGEVRGNYCTPNPLDTNSALLFANGNLDLSNSSGVGVSCRSTFQMASGKWYWEFTVGTAGTYVGGGIGTSAATTGSYTGDSGTSYGYLSHTGNKYNNGAASAYGATFTNGDVIGISFDSDAGTLIFYKNGSSQGTAFSSLTGGTYFPMFSARSGSISVNFGQRAFAYTAPSGFKALCTQNLPTPTIGATSTTQADNYFNVVTRTFTAATAVITGLGFSPDWLWFKRRNTAASHSLYDRLRGTNARLLTNGTNAEITTTSAELTSFDSDGFTIGSDPGSISINSSNGDTGVVWCWKANGAGSSNTAGTITSTVSANTTSGFSIVTYTGTGSASDTVGHGLGVTPAMVITKRRSSGSGAFNWMVKHSSLASNHNLLLESTSASTNVTTGFGAGGIANLSSSTTFGFLNGTDGNPNNSNTNAATYVAYCFAPVAGYSAFGSYTGNGSADGPFVYTGFRPRYVLVKRTDTGGAGFDWFIWDTARSTYNAASANLTANQSVAEGVTAYPLDINSNGLKITNSATAYNASGGTYIYAAFAEHPFKYSLAR